MSHIVFEFVEPKPRVTKQKILKITLILAAVIGIIVAGLQIAHMRASAPVNAIMDKLHAAPGWTQNGEVTANGKFCTGYPVPCDSMSRSYHSATEVTNDDVRKIVSESGLNLAVQEACGPSIMDLSISKECFASGVVDGYDVTIRATQSSKDAADSDINFSVSSVDKRWG